MENSTFYYHVVFLTLAYQGAQKYFLYVLYVHVDIRSWLHVRLHSDACFVGMNASLTQPITWIFVARVSWDPQDVTPHPAAFVPWHTHRHKFILTYLAVGRCTAAIMEASNMPPKN